MITVTAVRAFTDNYIWVLSKAGEAVVVDPGDAAPVLRFLEQEGLKLSALLITHHHSDHIGGVNKLKAAVPGLIVYGPYGLNGITHPVKNSDRVTVLGETFEVMDVPGHTLDHLAYANHEHLFCGDTLFGAGCGRLFEGTPQQMYASLQKLAALPDSTKVYPAHEYTLSNLRFAAAADPANPAVAQRIRDDGNTLANGVPTLPSSIGLEKQTNPFLRAHEVSLKTTAQAHSGSDLTDPAAVFAALRSWKNTF